MAAAFFVIWWHQLVIGATCSNMNKGYVGGVDGTEGDAIHKTKGVGGTIWDKSEGIALEKHANDL